MKQFVLMHYGGNRELPEKEMALVMQAWGEWFAALGEAIVDWGSPFSSDIRTVRDDGSVESESVETPASGYAIIQAESLGEALELAKGCPLHLSGGHLTVYEKLRVM